VKQPKVDFVIVMDELRKGGKVRISPISREANSFDCPKCGNLLSPENPDSYSVIGYDDHKSVLMQCKRCKTQIELVWHTASSSTICRQFKKSK